MNAAIYTRGMPHTVAVILFPKTSVGTIRDAAPRRAASQKKRDRFLVSCAQPIPFKFTLLLSEHRAWNELFVLRTFAAASTLTDERLQCFF